MRLPDLLVSEGIVRADTVVEVFEAQALYGGSFDTNLLELGVIDEKRLLPYLERSYNVQNRVDVLGEPSSDALARLPRKQAESTRIVPFRLNGRTLDVVCVDPADSRVLEEIGFATGLRLQANVAIEARVALHLYRGYGVPMPARLISVLQGKTWIKPLVSRRAGSSLPARAAASRPPETGPVWKIQAPDESATDQVLRVEPELLAPVEDPPRSEAELAQRLGTVTDRDQIPQLVLGFLSFLPRAVLFRVRKGDIIGWDARGAALARDAVPGLVFPLDATSIFSAVAGDVTPYEGPLPRGPVEESFVTRLGLPGFAEHIALVPVRVKGRVVALFYAELPRPVPHGALDAVQAAARHSAETLVRLILVKKGAT